MTGSRTKRAARIAAAMPLVSVLRAHERECDSTWWARHDSREDRSLWLVTPISHGTRDEDALADSNYEVAERILNDASGFSERGKWPDWTGQDGTVYPGTPYVTGGTSERSDAWPGGVIDTLLVRSDDAGALRALEGIVSALEGYPSLDDEHWSALECERNHPSGHECYAEDCSCPVAGHLGAIERLGERQAHLTLRPDGDGDAWCELCHAYAEAGPALMYLGDDMTEAELAESADYVRGMACE